eukprot:g36557.t1
MKCQKKQNGHGLHLTETYGLQNLPKPNSAFDHFRHFVDILILWTVDMLWVVLRFMVDIYIFDEHGSSDSGISDNRPRPNLPQMWLTVIPQARIHARDETAKDGPAHQVPRLQQTLPRS